MAKRGIEAWSTALEADDLTTRPTRQSSLERLRLSLSESCDAVLSRNWKMESIRPEFFKWHSQILGSSLSTKTGYDYLYDWIKKRSHT